MDFFPYNTEKQTPQSTVTAKETDIFWEVTPEDFIESVGMY